MPPSCVRVNSVEEWKSNVEKRKLPLNSLSGSDVAVLDSLISLATSLHFFLLSLSFLDAFLFFSADTKLTL